MSFLLSFLTTLSFLTSRVEWLNNMIEIKLKENIETYLYIPEAKLYLDGILTEDPLMFYERNGVERTFITTVNTSIVKTYVIKYRVTFPSFYVSSVETIYFNVIDDIPPVIISMPTFKIALSQAIPDLSLGLDYSDNYDAKDKLNVVIDSTQIIRAKIGIYPIYYHITDSSGNRTTGVSTLEIIDLIPPDITLKKPIIISYGSRLVYQDFLTIKDNYDFVVNVVIDDTLVDYNQLGTYKILVTATDQSGNQTSIELDLLIIDNTPPNIILKASPKQITVYQEITRELLLSYVLYVSDNYDKLEIEQLLIYHDIDNERLGVYSVFYTLYDSSLNKREVKLNIRVIDDVPPVLSIVAPLIFDVFSSLPHFINYIEVSDNYDQILKTSIKITASPKMDIIGVYPITFEVKDSSGNISIIRDYIYIIDRIPPVVIQVSEIIITDFSKRNLLSYFSATDQYDRPSHLIFSIDDHRVEYNKVGSYVIYISVYDTSNNVTTMESTVMVIDTIEPTLSLTQYHLSIQINMSPLIFEDFIKEAFDNYDDLTKQDVLITYDIDYSKIGLYIITFQLKDKSYNQVSHILTLKIDDITPPLITAFPLSLKLNQTFDPLIGIEVSDDTGIYTIKCYPNIIDTSKPGTQVITYIVTDQRGNYTKIQRLITIEKSNEQIRVQDYLPILMVTLISLSACYYFWKKL